MKKIAVIIVVLISYFAYGGYVRNNDYFAIPDTTNGNRNIVGNILEGLVEIVNARDNGNLTIRDNYNNNLKDLGYLSLSLPGISLSIYFDLADYYTAKHPEEEPITGEGEIDRVTVWIDGNLTVGVSSPVPISLGSIFISFDDLNQDPRRSFDLQFPQVSMPFIQINSWELNDYGQIDWSGVSTNFITEFSASLLSLSGNLTRFEIDINSLEDLLSFEADTNGDMLVDYDEMMQYLENFVDCLISFEDGFRILPILDEIQIYQFSSTDDDIYINSDGNINFCWGGHDGNGDGIPDNLYDIMPTIFGYPAYPQPLIVSFSNNGTVSEDYFISFEYDSPGWWIENWGSYYSLINDRRIEFNTIPPSNWYGNAEVLCPLAVATTINASDYCDVNVKLCRNSPILEEQITFDELQLRLYKNDLDNYPPSVNLDNYGEDLVRYTNEMLNITWDDSDPDDNASICLAIDPDLNETPWEGNANHTFIAVGLNEDDDGAQGNYNWTVQGVEPGTYSLWAMIYDGNSTEEFSKCDNTITISDDINANFSANPLSGYAPLEVEFENNSTGYITDYHWDFGDGYTLNSGGFFVNHVFESPGNYSVNLTVSNSSFCSSDEISINVLEDNQKPSVDITNPANNSVQSDNFVLQFTTSDNGSGLEDGEVMIDDIQYYYYQNLDATNQITINSLQMPNGQHTIEVIAHDHSGNTGNDYVNVTFDNGMGSFAHDYAITSISIDPPNPNENDVVTVTGSLMNMGLEEEDSGVVCKFYVDNNFQTQTQNIPSLSPGEFCDVSFNWNAQTGTHSLKIQAYLNNDENSVNDFYSHSIYIGAVGLLLVNGSFNPTLNITLVPDSEDNFELMLQNVGSQAINCNVSKGGNAQSWINLSDGNNVNVLGYSSVNYDFEVDVPSNTGVGNYNANIEFDYNSNIVLVNLNFTVIENEEGSYIDEICNNNIVINGESDNVITSFGLGPFPNFWLDNDDSTDWPTSLDIDPIYFSEDEYIRLNYVEWTTGGISEVWEEGTSTIRFKCNSELIAEFDEDSFGNHNFDVTQYINPGNNEFECYLTNYIHHAANALWNVAGSLGQYDLQLAAWGSSYNIPESVYENFEDHWDRGRLYFNVEDVYSSGEIHLFNNSILIDSQNITGTGTDHFNISEDELYESNYFVIKGDAEDDTHVILNGLYLDIQYFIGNPLIDCSKTVNSIQPNVNSNVTVNINIENVGGNYVEEFSYNDTNNLPAGISYVNGDISINVGNDIDPGESYDCSYVITSNIVGPVTLAATEINYEDEADNEYTTNSNTVTLSFWGGTLEVDGFLDNSLFEYGETVSINADVTGSILNNSISDALVTCNLSNNGNNMNNNQGNVNRERNEYIMGYNSQSGNYELNINNLTPGSYVVNINAQREYYDQSELVDPLFFTVEQDAYPELNNIEVISIEHVSAEISADLATMGEETNVYVRYGLTPEMNIESESIGFMVDQRITLIVGELLPFSTYYYQVIADNGLIYSTPILTFYTNNDPIIDFPGNITMLEDSEYSITLPDYLEDIDNDILVIEPQSNQFIEITVHGNGDTLLTFIPANNWFGSQDIVLEIFDNTDLEPILAEIIVTVENINDPPVINLPNCISFNSEDVIGIDFSDIIYDFDDDELALSVEGNNFVQVNIDGLYVTFNVDDSWSGEEDLIFYVDDQVNRLVASDVVHIIVFDEYNQNEDLIADFHSSSSSVLLNNQISFYDDSFAANPIVNWEWDFNNDGQIDSYQQNPNWVYEDLGTYTVSLTIIDYYGNIAIESKTNYIEVVDELDLAEPVNLSTSCLGEGDVLFNWDGPDQSQDWYHYDDGVNFDGIGLSAGGDFMVAARWEPQMVIGVTMEITKVRIFPRGESSDYELKIWTGENAQNEIYSQAISPVIDEWNEIVLDEPVDIGGWFDELWVGYAIYNQPEEEYPAGCDDGPAEIGYSDMFYYETMGWISLYDVTIPNLSYNWNIQFYTESYPIYPPGDSTIANHSGNLWYSHSSSQSGNYGQPVLIDMGNLEPGGSLPDNSINRALTGYNVFLNDEYIDYVTETEYLFENIIYGLDYEAGVSAVYDEGESEIVSTDFNCPPILDPGFIVINPSIIIGDEVCFEDTSYSDNEIVNWLWDFDVDGQTDIENDPNPCWAYTVSGTYYVTLIIIDIGGNSAQITEEVEIIVEPDTLNPPSNPEIYCQGQGEVLFDWDEPNQTDNWFHYDNGVNSNAVGLSGGGGDFAVATKWDCFQHLIGGAIFQLSKIRFYPASDSAEYVLKIWQGDNAETEVFSLPIDPVIGEWNEIDLDESVIIGNLTGDYVWVGYEVINQLPGAYPAGCDSGPAVQGWGDMYYYEPIGWQSISSIYGDEFNVNWNIQFYVIGDVWWPCSTGSWYSTNRSFHSENESQKHNNYESDIFSIVESDIVSLINDNNVQRALTGYNVFLNDEYIDYVTETEYLFENIIYGLDYEAGVSAVYDEGESEIVSTDFNCPPILDPGFIVINPSIILGDEVCFEDASYSDNEIVNWLWDFDGDGQNIESDPNPCYPYTVTGTYYVTLIIYDIYGYSGEVTMPVYIEVIPGIIYPPGNLNVECLPDSEALFSWSDPVLPEAGWLHYDNGINQGGIGLNGGGTFYAATRWLAGDLIAYDGETISIMRIYIIDNYAQFTLKIWSGEYAENEILSQSVVPSSYSWNEIELDNPVTIDASSTLWVGYQVSNSLPDQYPAGCDAGPAVTGYGDLISIDAQTWEILSGEAANHNWNIQFYVDGIARPLPLTRSKKQLVSKEFSMSRNDFNFAENEFSSQSSNAVNNRDLNGYEVFLDNDYLDFVTDNQYLLTGIEPGQLHNAGVKAVYDSGTSSISWIDFICGYLIIADFYADNTTIIPGEQVCFTDDSQSNYPIISWRWDFDGNGQTDIEDEPNPCWVYTYAGVYSVTLEVEDSQGNIDQVTYEDYITVQPGAPDWNVNSSDFEYNGSIVSIVYLNDELVDNVNGILGCFVGDECRGVASLEKNSVLDYTATLGYIYFTPMVYSDQTSGETLSFKYWDPETGEIVPVWETIEFEVDMAIGDFDDPFEFHAYPFIWIEKQFNNNWNWFSLNVSLDDLSINNILDSIDDSGYLIKNKDYFAQYNSSYGWLGSLSIIDLTSMYMIKMLEPDTLEVCGNPVNVNEIVYEIDPGWNWISYSPQYSEDINYALSGLGSNVEYIKNKDYFAEYNSSYSMWLGSLTTLQPLDGYKLNADIACNFTYPEPETFPSCFSNDLKLVNSKKEGNNYRDFNSDDYEFNGSLVLSADSDVNNDSRIYVFCNNEIRGIAPVLDYSELMGQKFYALMVYSNSNYEEGFQLYYQESAAAELIPLDHYFNFNSDMIIGDFDNPFIINLPQSDNDGIAELSESLTIYPNPFNPETTIKYELLESGKVKIEVYNIKGQRIAVLVDDNKDAGRYSLIWNAEEYNSGIYFIRLNSDSFNKVKKAILLK